MSLWCMHLQEAVLEFIVLSISDQWCVASARVGHRRRSRVPCYDGWSTHRSCRGLSCGCPLCSLALLAMWVFGHCRPLPSCSWSVLLHCPHRETLRMPYKLEPFPGGRPQSEGRSNAHNNWKPAWYVWMTRNKQLRSIRLNTQWLQLNLIALHVSYNTKSYTDLNLIS